MVAFALIGRVQSSSLTQKMMKFTRAIALIEVVIVALPVPAHAKPSSASLEIVVENVSAMGGTLRVALYDAKGYAGHNGKPIRAEAAPAIGPKCIVDFESVPPGVYAVKVYQDINNNDHFDTDWMGHPAEPFGFSNDAKPGFDQPSFKLTKFDPSPGSNTAIVRLQ